MSDDQNTDNKTDESPNVKQMRETIEQQQKRLAEYEGALRLTAFKTAGIDPEKGIGKAIYRTYEGEIDPDQIKAFAAEEYDYTVENTNSQSGSNVPAGQRRAQEVMSSGQHENPPSALDKADEAAKNGDWITSAAMKDKELFNVAEKTFNRYG